MNRSRWVEISGLNHAGATDRCESNSFEILAVRLSSYSTTPVQLSSFENAATHQAYDLQTGQRTI
jgi:hypothetical protein